MFQTQGRGKYVRTIVNVLLLDGDRVKANAIERLAAFSYAIHYAETKDLVTSC